ncbi:MAG: DUF3667 domain-containing protein [Longimicrobiales bacterium]
MHEELVPPFRAWVSEFAEEVLLVEGRLPRTLAALFWPPGRLTEAWWRGHRARFVRPLRVYLLFAVGFFFLFSLRTGDDSAGEQNVYALLIYVGYEVSGLGGNAAFQDEPLLGPLPADQASDPVARAEWQRRFEARRAGVRERRAQDDARVAAGLRRMVDLASVLVGVVMVPLLAWMLAVGVGQGTRYVARLVASLHLHAAAYALFAVVMLVSAPLLLAVAGSFLYLGLALRRLGGHGWFHAFGRALLVVVAYAISFTVLYGAMVFTTAQVAPEWVFGG